MIAIFSGNSVAHAARVQDAVNKITALERRSTIQERKGARKLLTRDAQGRVIAESDLPQQSRVSAAARRADGRPIAMADFPDDFAFGNGVTCNALVTLADGESVRLSWCVFPDPAPAAVTDRWPDLEALFASGG